MKKIALTGCIICLFACTGNTNLTLSKITLRDLKGTEVHLDQMASSGILVLTFMSPDCPLCINYTRTIRLLHEEFLSDHVNFVMVYAGRYHTVEEILEFQKEYQLELQGILDPDFKLTRMVSASVTPQVIVIAPEQKIVYSGAIDDWAYTTGKKRAVVKQHYLEGAIRKVLNDSLPEPRITEPIGCIIEL